VKFYQKSFSFEAEFSDFRPGECVDPLAVLVDKNPGVSHRQLQRNAYNKKVKVKP